MCPDATHGLHRAVCFAIFDGSARSRIRARRLMLEYVLRTRTPPLRLSVSKRCTQIQIYPGMSLLATTAAQTLVVPSTDFSRDACLRLHNTPHVEAQRPRTIVSKQGCAAALAVLASRYTPKYITAVHGPYFYVVNQVTFADVQAIGNRASNSSPTSRD